MYNTQLPLPQHLLPAGVMGMSHQGRPSQGSSADNIPQPVESSLPRIINFLADYGGCGFYRILWPEMLINMSGSALSQSTTCMIAEPGYYKGVKAVRIQRQATPDQLKFVKHLKEIQKHFPFKLIYEVDDVVFNEDIPDYNRFKFAFDNSVIQESIREIINLCDVVTVTNDYMKDLYAKRTGHSNVQVIPNYPPHFWLGKHYNETQIEVNYARNKKKPRILYPGSGAHIDFEKKSTNGDDFTHVVNAIKRTVDKFQWVFLGGMPTELNQLALEGKVELHPWVSLVQYPEMLSRLACQAVIAPLQDNSFNLSKSNIKFVEAAMLGLPAICQDMVTYKDCPYRFKTGDEMVSQLEDVLRSRGNYMNVSKKLHKIGQQHYLENADNINKHLQVINS